MKKIGQNWPELTARYVFFNLGGCRCLGSLVSNA